MIRKTIHQIWIGPKKCPNEYQVFSEEWKTMYPDFVYTLWDDALVRDSNIVPDNKKKYIEGDYPIAMKADIIRYEIIFRMGGIYIDIDFQPLRRMDDFMLNCKFFTGIQPNGQTAIGIFGAEPQSEVLKDVCATVVDNIENKLAKGCKMEYVDQLTGPEFFTRITDPYKQDPQCFFFNPAIFYPYWMDEPERRNEDFKQTSPSAYGVHHWSKNWTL